MSVQRYAIKFKYVLKKLFLLKERQELCKTSHSPVFHLYNLKWSRLDF